SCDAALSGRHPDDVGTKNGDSPDRLKLHSSCQRTALSSKVREPGRGRRRGPLVPVRAVPLTRRGDEAVPAPSSAPSRKRWAHLGTTTVVDSLSPQRSAGRGLGRGAFDLCLPMVPAELLLSPTLSSTPRRRGRWWYCQDA